MSYIKFINHASVLFSNDKIGLLTDPWYEGSILNDGWCLLYENETSDIQPDIPCSLIIAKTPIITGDINDNQAKERTILTNLYFTYFCMVRARGNAMRMLRKHEIRD